MSKNKYKNNLLELKKSARILQKPNEILKLIQISETKSDIKRKKTKFLLLISLSIIFFILCLLIWFVVCISPVNTKSNDAIIFIIKEGQTQTKIASELKKAGLIRNEVAFNIYNYLVKSGSSLQAGKYKLFKHDSLPEIVKKITSGSGSELIITFYPGNNIMQNRQVLIENGFTVNDINNAYSSKYDHPLLNIKPVNNDIEGFLYADTYHYFADADLKTIFYKAFDEMKKNLDNYNLEVKFKNKGLTLYEGIILASIIQKEVSSPLGDVASDDQKMVAGIFFNRLSIGMNLGSDVTYQYIADKLGLKRSPTLDNPYNTRKYSGLPPGPVSTPSLSSMIAVSEPLVSKYYYFLSGDDNKMYYATTNSEHERNITLYCKLKCKSN